MIYVLDTHVLYWYLFEPARLSDACRRAIAEGETGKASLIVPAIVLAELYFLLSKIEVDGPLPNVVNDLQNNPNCRIEPMGLEDLLSLASYPEIPEMHDRLIVAVSQRLGGTLITKDRKIQASPRTDWLW